VIRYFSILAAMLMLALVAAACGKVGPPEPPGPPDQVHYPKFYPTQ
jgi:predicted small lipoprotein YifL